MKSKLGFHIDVQTHPGQVEKMVAAQPKVIKVIHSMGLLQHLYTDTVLSHNTTFIARVNVAHESFPNYMQGTNPKSAALRWFNETLPYLKQAPFAYWESFNEMTSWDWLQAYGEFEAERQRIMYEEGYKACIGNFAVGTPDIDSWDEFYPALSAAHEYRNLLGLHEYGGLYMSMWYERNQTAYIRTFPDFDRFPDSYGEGWLFGRYRKVWNEHIFPNNWNSIRIVLTEFGFDGVATQDTQWLSGGTTTGSWKTCMPVWARLDAERGGGNGPQFYVKNLQWADSQMQHDPYMIGAAIFTWGTFPESRWVDWEIEGEVADTVCDYIAATRDVPGFYTTSPKGQYIRLYPDEDALVLGTVYPDSPMKKIGHDVGWYKVETVSGIRGWVQSQWVMMR